ncbi:hypothetical protein Dsin_018944 [Dipteronia sinensis]|uniref:Reverse transcriptase domain-containing protein n=1 Tax=Dipteronia sinensis TaxID=43782 RepID=A0AAE0E2D4_9ROSI|nr:hypothetical protein Dsin_018944 [Dipteronia sinensis]
MMVRRRRNKLEGLKGEDGVWRCDKESMIDVAISYFKNLFTGMACVTNYDCIPQSFPCLEDSEIADLSKVVSEEEVRSGLFGIGGLKAPGPDGYPAIFFQNQWDVCKEDLVKFVVDSFRLRRFPAELNQTLITLVPKVPSPLDMTQLRPISLCNTVYKVISKIIVRRLINLLPKLISPNQVVFVPGLGSDLVELIMWSITSVQYRVVLNGEVIEPFTPGCGIRQEDPFSPYIFVLCMEKLSHLINQELNSGRWKCIKDSKSVSASPESSALTILQKGLLGILLLLVGLLMTKNLGKYLGVPLIHGRITNHTCTDVTEKVQ